MLDSILDRISRAHAVYKLSALAWLISLPALLNGFQADDHVYRAALAARHADIWHLFTLTPAEMAEQRARGFWVWWTSPRMRIDFVRPLSWLNHWLEYTLFPNGPAVMLLINTLLYAGCVLLAVKLYTRFIPSARTATLAGLMYAVDEAHAQAEGWISSRNTLLTALFALAALLTHVNARETRSRWLQAASALCAALALLAGEAGLWAPALLIAYALVIDDRAYSARVRSLLPALGVSTLWGAFYIASGPHGAPGSAFYHDLSRPVAALGQGLADLPIWAATLFGPSIATALLTVPSAQARIIAALFSIIPLVCVITALRSKPAHFFALATGLCLLPVLLTVPQDRTSFGATFGAFGWIACFCERAANASRLPRLGRTLLLFTHVLGALLAFPLALRSVKALDNGTQLVAAVYAPGIEQVVVLNAPMEVIGNYALNLISLPANASRSPDSSHTLYAGSSDLTVFRRDRRSIELRSVRGWAYAPIEHSFCATAELPRAGDERHARGLTVRVLSTTASGLPERVRFTFDTDLEDPRRKWLRWQPYGPVVWQPPTVGESVEIAGVPVFKALPFGHVPAGAQ